MDLIKLANKLGIGDHPHWGAELDALLVQLRRDVALDTTDLGDGHPRFGHHVALLTWGGDEFPTFDIATDDAAASGDPTAATNKLTRELIDQIRAEM